MKSEPPTFVEKNYELILKEEENFSRTVASQVIEKPTVSAWMIFFPFIVIHYFLNLKRFKSGVEVFARDFLQNKKVALDSAKKSINFGLEKRETIERNFFSNKNEEDSERTKILKEKQLKEIDILFDHYERLLRTPGESFHSLVKKVYLTEFSYRQFLIKLQRAEKETYEEIINLYGENKDFTAIVRKIESVVERLREEEIRRIF